MRRTVKLPSLLLVLAATTPVTVSAQDAILEEIVVVGSRIQKPDYAFSNPVLSVDADSIRYSGTTNLTDFLKEVPALTASLDSNDAAATNAFIDGTGLELLNLRNLGVDRTLVLVNGRRHVSGLPGSAAVDVDTIPIGLIDRVEVLTGGASAIYGADGVSGVVNFVTKTDFEGFDVRTQTGQSGESDAEQSLLAVTAGTNFADDRGNIAMALEYSRESRLKSTDRRFAAGGGRQVFSRNPNDLDDDPGIPDEIPIRDTRFFDSSRDGAVDTDFDFVKDFNGDDTPFDTGTIPFIPPFYQQGGDGTPRDDFLGDLIPEQERVTGNLFFDYEFSPRANLFGELKYSGSDSFSRSQPTFDFFLYIEPDYAFLPPNIAAAAGGEPVLVSRDHFDLGVRGEDIERETVRGVLGLKGELTEGIDYETSYVYGQTKVKNRVLNNRLNDRFAAALDAVVDDTSGNVVCRSDLDADAVPFNIPWNEGSSWNEFERLPGTWAGSFRPGAGSGCVPVNIFGDGSVSSAARDWIMATTENDSELTQQVVQAFMSGSTDAWFSLPAGGIGFALGAEWREEESSNVPSDEDRSGVTFGNIIQPTKGDYSVKEVFAEVDIPLLADLPGAKALNVDGAIRFSDYSTIGNATTWKLGLVWRPVDDIIIRGTTAEATRAPNIGELFDPGGQTFEQITDPCDVGEQDQGSEFRAINCASILAGLGVDPNTFIDPNSSAIPGSLSGNPDLIEEVAETDTIGIVLQPSFIDNLVISVDWYDITVTDAINTAEPEEAAELCVDLPTINNDFCDVFVREQGTGAIVDFTLRPVNVANFTTEGFDFSVNYTVDPSDWGASADLGLFNLRLIGNKLEELTFINLPGATPDPDLGEEDAPEWQASFDLTWQRGALLVNYGFTYFDETQRYELDERVNNPDIAERKYLDYNAHFVQDLHIGYDLSEAFSFYGGINNLTNEKPDIGETFYPVSAVGRFFYLGMEVHLDRR